MRVCIAYAGDLSEPSGGTDRVSALTTGLVDREYDVTLVTPAPQAVLSDRLDAVTIRTVSPVIDNNAGRALSVARLANRLAGPDTHIQFEHSLLGSIGGLLGRSSFILDMHDLAYARYDHVSAVYAPMARGMVSRLERYATRGADQVVVVSEYMREFLREEWDVPSDRITVIPNGYFPDVVERARGTPVTAGRVCFLGTIHPKVDIGALCRIAELPDVDEMVVIGDGAKRKRLERLAPDYDALRITGRIPDHDAFELVASAEVVVNPQEPSELQRSSAPVKLYYYAALGKPIVATRGPSVIENLLEHNAALAPSTREDFIAAVTELLTNQTRAEALGENAAATARQYRWSTRVDALDNFYQTIDAP